MKNTICRPVCALWEAAKAPEVRHEIHYECGLYKKKTDHTPIASMHLGNDFSISLIKLLAVIVGIITAMAMLRSLCRVWNRLFHHNGKDCTKD